jgi:4-amino-4-deoxy-L-arabinose transferase-like glycosyltransferase
LVLTFVAYQKRWLFSTGLLLTLAFLIKIPLGLLFLYFLYKRESRVVISSIASYVAIVLASILIFSIQLHVEYFNEAVIKNAGSTLLAYNGCIT